MSEPFVFDSRCTLCKDPFGAAHCGGHVTFSCRPLLREGFTHCAVVLRLEFSETRREVELSPGEAQGERALFTGSVEMPDTPELIWYHFRFWREDSSGCDLDRTGYRSDGFLEPWQLTVYQQSPCPRWFGAGLTYQIFPDRFRRLPGDSPDPTGLVGNRWVHENWADTPEWRPDPDGEIRNRDFFGGTIQGIISRLPDLYEFGVTTLYLNPIFESASNHRYNTANYLKIDPMLGTEEDFCRLCHQAHTLGMRVILDGVFNHTGSQSLYFNADGFYPTLGAAQSQDSPYFDWYSFHPWPTDYDSWWGINTLPAVREDTPSYLSYMVTGEDSVIRHWLRAGADGWRLDVADELPDRFIETIRSVMEETKPCSVLIGEVWEDASNKIAYSQRRKYLLGSELHGVMNYPFRTALLAYLQGGGAQDFREAMETLREHYPPAAFYSAMNFLGTHDTPRILTVLGASQVPQSKDARAAYRLSPAERQRGEALVRLASLILFTFPGSPTVYYGDEVGLEGFEDPFNRGTFPLGPAGSPLTPWFLRLGALRKEMTSLQRGTIDYLAAQGPLLAYTRTWEDQIALTVVNAGDARTRMTLPWSAPSARDIMTGRVFPAGNGRLELTVNPLSGMLLV